MGNANSNRTNVFILLALSNLSSGEYVNLKAFFGLSNHQYKCECECALIRGAVLSFHFRIVFCMFAHLCLMEVATTNTLIQNWVGC